jgi:hypothetical protein
VPGARTALFPLGKREELEAGKERNKTGQVAIVVRVRLGVAAANKGVGSDRPAVAELRIPLRQHRTLVEPSGLQNAPDLGETAADIAHRAVKYDVPRQHIVETLVGERQCVGIGLTQAQSEAARGRLAASEVEAGGGAIDRLDGKAVLGEEQCVPADTATVPSLHETRLSGQPNRDMDDLALALMLNGRRLVLNSCSMGVFSGSTSAMKVRSPAAPAILVR